MSRETAGETAKGASALPETARPAIVAVIGLSVAANLLLLASPVYMLQIYDRVITSGSLT